VDELDNIVSREFSWRRKELTNIKNLSLSSRNPIKITLLKTGVALLYSHWEGFVKNISIAYCEYINHQGLKYEQLTKNFHVCALLEEFQGQYPHRNFKSALSIVDGSSLVLHKKCKINAEKYIDTAFNLNSEMLREIVLKIGMDYSQYELKANLIDEKFLGLRNAISHGEYRVIEETDFIELFDEVTVMIEIFKNQVLNAAIQKTFLNNCPNAA
jgi:hypothetical protein